MSNIFVYNSNTEKIAAQARVVQSNDELAEICKSLNVADEIFLGHIDLWLAKLALSAVYRALKQYPYLRLFLQYMGTLNGFNSNKAIIISQLHTGIGQAYSNIADKTLENISTNCRAMFEKNGLASAFCISVGASIYSGIMLNGKSFNKQTVLDNLEYGEKVGHSPKGCNSIKSTVEHELGHLFDFMLGISTSHEYQAFIKQFTVNDVYNNLSHYCISNNEIDDREVIAEAFSEYHNNISPRLIAKTVGKMIEKRYIKKYGNKHY